MMTPEHPVDKASPDVFVDRDELWSCLAEARLELEFHLDQPRPVDVVLPSVNSGREDSTS